MHCFMTLIQMCWRRHQLNLWLEVKLINFSNTCLLDCPLYDNGCRHQSKGKKFLPTHVIQLHIHGALSCRVLCLTRINSHVASLQVPQLQFIFVQANILTSHDLLSVPQPGYIGCREACGSTGEDLRVTRSKVRNFWADACNRWYWN